MAPRKPKIETPPPEAKAPEAPEAKKAEVGKFVSKQFTFFHPFQRVQIPVGGGGVTLELDSWLQSQIDAGFIVKL